MRNINIINKSTVVTNDDFIKTVAACQKQIDIDFSPWVGTTKNNVLTILPEDVKKERIYILDNTDQADALGYHEEISSIPTGFVFAKTDIANNEAWSSTFSHELLEQLVDPFINLTALVSVNNNPAVLAYEICDPVENDEYLIDGIKMSNFIRPSWYLGDSSKPFDFMGTLSAAFTLSPGGYLAYMTTLGQWLFAFGAKIKQQQMTASKFSRRSRLFHRAGRQNLAIST